MAAGTLPQATYTFSMAIERPHSIHPASIHDNLAQDGSCKMNSKGRIILQKSIARDVLGINLPSRASMDVTELTYENKQLKSFILSISKTQTKERITLTRYRQSCLLNLNNFFYLNDFNYKLYQFSLLSEPVIREDGSKGIRLTILEKIAWHSGINQKEELELFPGRFDSHTNQLELPVSPTAPLTPGSDKPIAPSNQVADLVDSFLSWKTMHEQECDGFEFEQNFAAFCKEFITHLFRCALPHSLPYKQGPSELFYSILTKTPY